MANFVIDKYKLDITPQGNYPVVYLSQYEDGRDVSFYMLNRGFPLDIPSEGISVFVSGLKSNGGYFEHRCDIADSNTVIVHVDSDMTDVSGRGVATLTFTDLDDKKVISAKFVMNVQEGVSDGGIEIPTEAETIFQQLLDEIRQEAAKLDLDMDEIDANIERFKQDVSTDVSAFKEDVTSDVDSFKSDVNDAVDAIDARMDNFIATQSGTSNGTKRTETVLYNSDILSYGNVEDYRGYFNLLDDISNYDYVEVRYSAFGKTAVKILKSSDIIDGVHWSESEHDGQVIIDSSTGNRSTLRIADFHVIKVANNTVSLSAYVWGWNGASTANGKAAENFTQNWNATNNIYVPAVYSVGIYSIIGVKYEEAGTDKDAELTDIRVGVDGTTYQTAGAAVRGQINDVYYGGKNALNTTWVAGNLEDDGSIVQYPYRYSTLEYMSYNENVKITNDVEIILCTYDSNHNVLSRALKRVGSFTIPRDTVFRICAINVNSGSEAASNVFVQGKGVLALISELNDKINTLAGTDVTAYLNSNWVSGNLEDDGSIVPFNGRYSTEQYMSYDTDISMTPLKVVVLCTYDSNHTVLTRSVKEASQEFTITKDTIFRICVVNVSSASEAKESAIVTFNKSLREKQDAPVMLGTFGQFLSLDENLDAKWVNIIDDIDLIQCFENFGVIGDSISAGYTNIGGISISSANAVLRKANWPSYMELDIGRVVTNYSRGGSATIDWRNTHKSNIEVEECYILYLGGNDMYNSYALGSSSDIVADFNNNAQSYYGNYDYIVRYIHSIAPNSVIFCISNTKYDNSKYVDYNVACEYIANLYNYCHYIDINAKVNVYKEFFDLNFNGHFSPIGYNLYGKCIQHALNEYIYNNPLKFLGIPYSTDPPT